MPDKEITFMLRKRKDVQAENIFYTWFEISTTSLLADAEDREGIITTDINHLWRLAKKYNNKPECINVVFCVE